MRRWCHKRAEVGTQNPALGYSGFHRAFKVAPRPGAQLVLSYRQLGTAISLSQRRSE